MSLYFYTKKDDKTIASLVMTSMIGSYFYYNFFNEGGKYHFPYISCDHPSVTVFYEPFKYSNREIIDIYDETDRFILNFREIIKEFPVNEDPKKNSQEKEEVEHFLLKLNWMCMYCRKNNAELHKETD